MCSARGKKKDGRGSQQLHTPVLALQLTWITFFCARKFGALSTNHANSCKDHIKSTRRQDVATPHRWQLSYRSEPRLLVGSIYSIIQCLMVDGGTYLRCMRRGPARRGNGRHYVMGFDGPGRGVLLQERRNSEHGYRT